MTKDSRYIPKKEFDEIYSRVPRLTVEVVVCTPKGIILTERNIPPAEGQWHIPGGTVYFGERLHEAVERVAKDELNVMVRIMRQIGYIEYPELHGSGYPGWPVGIVFETIVAKGQVRGSEQGERIGYFTSVPEHTVPEQAAFLDRAVFDASTF